MNNIEIIEHMKSNPKIEVDCNFRQGREVLLNKLIKRSGEDEKNFVDARIADVKQRIAAMVQKAKPYAIPEKYIFFLEYYGGITVDHEDYYFSTFGVGAMVEEYYSSIDSDDAHPGLLEREGFLPIGQMNFRRGECENQYVSFFLDLSGKIQKNSIVAVGPWGFGTAKPEVILAQSGTYPNLCHIIADSFTEWLKHLAETEGGFGYVW